MIVELPENMAVYLPGDYFLVMTYGILRAYSKDESGFFKMRFHCEDNQAGFCSGSDELEAKGPWDQFQGEGISLDLFSRSTRQGRFTAFTRRDGHSLIVKQPARGLHTTATRAMTRRTGLFGDREIPFSHTNDSLTKFIWDVLDLAQPTKLNYFGYVAANRSNGRGNQGGFGQ